MDGVWGDPRVPPSQPTLGSSRYLVMYRTCISWFHLEKWLTENGQGLVGAIIRVRFALGSLIHFFQVDKYIRKLDGELSRFEQELQLKDHAGRTSISSMSDIQPPSIIGTEIPYVTGQQSRPNSRPLKVFKSRC